MTDALAMKRYTNVQAKLYLRLIFEKPALLFIILCKIKSPIITSQSQTHLLSHAFSTALHGNDVQPLKIFLSSHEIICSKHAQNYLDLMAVLAARWSGYRSYY